MSDDTAMPEALSAPLPTDSLDDWATYAQNSSVPVRERLVIIAALEIAQRGLVDFNAKAVCETGGVQFSIINYYFGGRDGLLAEAAHWAHEQWARNVTLHLSPTPIDATKQLRMMCEGELLWNERWRSLSTFGAYPDASPSVRSRFADSYTARAQQIIEFHLAVLTQIIIDGRAKRKTLVDFDIDTAPKKRLALHAPALLAAISLEWSLHGLCVWVAGQHIPSQNMEDPTLTSVTTTLAIKNHISTIIATALKD